MDTISSSNPTRGTFWSRLDGSNEPYLLATPGVTRPQGLVIYLHGHGSDLEQGMDVTSYQATFGRLRAELERRCLAYATLNYRGNTSWMSPAAESDVSQLIDLLSAQLGTDKIYLIGGSMGGTSTLIYAVTNPARLSGVLAICGASDISDFYRWSLKQTTAISKEIAAAIAASYGATPEDKPELFENRSALKQANRLTMPVYLTHGSNDPLISVTYSRDLYAKLQAQKTPVTYVEIEGGGHNTPAEVVDWNAALDFLQGRSKR